MAKGSFNILPVAARWWAQDGSNRQFAYFVLPAAVGAAILVFGLRADNLGAFLTGALFFSGILFNTMFQVHGWSVDAAAALEDEDDRPIGSAWELERHRRRLRAVGRLYDSLTWATLVSVVLTVALLVLNTESTGGQERRDLVYTTAVAGFVGTHLLVVLTAVINRLFIVTRSTVDEHQRKSPG
ncbi:MAG: hypothetical protein M3O70_09255 [Actinomycetota bacterium]|nr:hypothetical protein [Actinomycetota bacterium]